ncbi:glutamate--tRNA ligase [bacterium]|nr:glutamate--tRNA ligase [bacterium]MDB4089346.1 glutamate--tRNA ligase [Flavobacteriales bacterium]
MSERVRVRFAPSPTGPLHVGGVRTALFNYLFAKKHGGDFILRIEDTDQKRFVEGAEEYVINALKWAGIPQNEGQGVGGEYGPYKQSERMHLYKEYADYLLENDKAYYAFDSSEELTEARERSQKEGKTFAYDAITRQYLKNSTSLSADEVNQRIESGEPFVIRMKLPRNEEVRFHDEIRGWVVVNTANMDDKVLYKSDGLPTYHLANIVDDHLMKITHVIRGEEWLPSAPLHVLLYQYLGWEDSMPKFAHLPLILKPDGKGKLSKRDGVKGGFPVFPLEWKDPATGDISAGYREDGYFKEAFVNMLAFLGWNPGTEQEIFNLDELSEVFSLERVGKSGAKFDPVKTKWFNEQYLRSKSNEELASLLKPLLDFDVEDDYLEKVSELLKERAVFVKDMTEDDFYFKAPTNFDEKTIKKKWKENTPQIIEELIVKFNGIEDFSSENVEIGFKEYLSEKEIGMGAVLPNFRVLVTGKGLGPSMFQISAILGKEETINRLNSGLERFK